jgi:hypothetical protein
MKEGMRIIYQFVAKLFFGFHGLTVGGGIGCGSGLGGSVFVSLSTSA